MPRTMRTILLLVFLAIGHSGAALAATAAQDVTAFPALTPDQRVYDETGSSLAPDQVAALDAQLATLQASGADVIVYVRALDASPQETFDQVEALQQAWVATTGTDQDTAVAILINRNPDDANDARAGIFVGKTYHDGNVPEEEQRAIVDEELIPPLREGDVYASLQGGLERLDSSIRNGPPKNAFERWSGDAGESWLPWVGVVLAIPGGAAALSTFRRRQTTSRTAMLPTTDRPGDLEPAVAGALVHGGPQPSAIPATLLSLAERGALAIEPESEGGTFSKPKVQVRLLDETPARSEIDRTLWMALVREAEGDLVSSKELQRIAAKTTLLNGPIDDALRAAGWRDAASGAARGWLVAIGILALGLAVFGFVVAIAGSAWLMLAGVIPLAAVGISAITMAILYSPLSRAGQEAALPWKAYKEGLKQAAKDRAIDFDLDRVFVDAVALNLGNDFDDRLKDVAESGATLRAFQGQQGAGMANAAVFPYWVAYSSVFTSSSGSPAASSSTVSGGGAGGGGGAAGST